MNRVTEISPIPHGVLKRPLLRLSVTFVYQESEEGAYVYYGIKRRSMALMMATYFTEKPFHELLRRSREDRPEASLSTLPNTLHFYLFHRATSSQ